MIYGYDYREIAESETDPYQPPTTDLFKALQKNWIAGFEGSPLAPRILGEGVATAANGLPVLTITATGGNELTEGADPVNGATSNATTSFVVAKTWTMLCFTGSCRLAFTHARGGGSAGESQAIVTVNGSQIASWQTINSTGRTVDIDIQAGDIVRLEHRMTGGVGGPSSNISNITMTGSNAYVPVSAYRRAVP